MNTLHLFAVLGCLVAVDSGCSSGNAGTSAPGASSGSAGHAGASLGSAGSAGSDSNGNGGVGAGGVVQGSGTGAASSGAGAAGANGGSAGSAGSSGAMQPPAGWVLAWSDEFNGAKGDLLDTSKWRYDVGPNNANVEQEYYTDRPENSGMDGEGHFLITALHEDYMGHQYTSAKLTSSGTYEPKYGRLEARIQLPSGKGLWPAFWALGTDIGDVGWPDCGEMDIMETVGDQVTMNHGSLHGPGYFGNNSLSGTYTLPGGQQFSDGFHVFAAEWEENVVRFYVDDQLYETKTPADVPAGRAWVYDHGVFMILNVAVGGTWPGNPDNSIFPRSMLIDYVRVYERPTR